jgi:cytidylate kinase
VHDEGRQLVVAVDGPSGSGKSTISRRVAQALNARYLDTGAMYRAVTYAVLRDNVDLRDADKIAAVAEDVELSIGTDPTSPHISVDGIGVDREIRGPEVTQAVSAVSAVPAVRALLVARQREIIAESNRIVVEGRDIGTVVAPDADLKVYLTAPAAAAARTPPTRPRPPRTSRGATGSTRPVPPTRCARPRTPSCSTRPSSVSARSSSGSKACSTR